MAASRWPVLLRMNAMPLVRGVLGRKPLEIGRDERVAFGLAIGAVEAPGEGVEQGWLHRAGRHRKEAVELGQRGRYAARCDGAFEPEPHPHGGRLRIAGIHVGLEPAHANGVVHPVAVGQPERHGLENANPEIVRVARVVPRPQGLVSGDEAVDTAGLVGGEQNIGQGPGIGSAGVTGIAGDPQRAVDSIRDPGQVARVDLSHHGEHHPGLALHRLRVGRVVPGRAGVVRDLPRGRTGSRNPRPGAARDRAGCRA